MLVNAEKSTYTQAAADRISTVIAFKLAVGFSPKLVQQGEETGQLVLSLPLCHLENLGFIACGKSHLLGKENAAPVHLN